MSFLYIFKNTEIFSKACSVFLRSQWTCQLCQAPQQLVFFPSVVGTNTDKVANESHLLPQNHVTEATFLTLGLFYLFFTFYNFRYRREKQKAYCSYR